MAKDGQKNLNSKGEDFKCLVYRQPDKQDTEIRALMKDESVWLSRKSMAELFGCSVDNIALHLKNIFKIGELEEKSVTEKISATASDGKKYQTYFYNLDAIISVGYRVNSKKATEFRIWATQILKEYLVRGMAIDQKRMQRDMEYARLLERAEKLRVTEQELRTQIANIAREYKAARKNAGQISQEFRESFGGGVNYGTILQKSIDEAWWEKLGGIVTEFFEHLDNLTSDGTELYDYIENLVNETPFRPLISDFVSDTKRITQTAGKHVRKIGK